MMGSSVRATRDYLRLGHEWAWVECNDSYVYSCLEVGLARVDPELERALSIG